MASVSIGQSNPRNSRGKIAGANVTLDKSVSHGSFVLNASLHGCHEKVVKKIYKKVEK